MLFQALSFQFPFSTFSLSLSRDDIYENCFYAIFYTTPRKNMKIIQMTFCEVSMKISFNSAILCVLKPSIELKDWIHSLIGSSMTIFLINCALNFQFVELFAVVLLSGYNGKFM